VAAALLFVPLGNEGQATASPLVGEPFSEARLAALRKEGRPVFAYFTADWCITCKVNEKGVLQREKARAFAQATSPWLVGDWTGWRRPPLVASRIRRDARVSALHPLWRGQGSEIPPADAHCFPASFQ
jgi:hypothetical protein